MESYRVEKRATIRISLADEDGEIGPVPTGGGGRKPEPELDHLSSIVRAFNEHWGNIAWWDADGIHRRITREFPEKVAADTAYQNAKRHSDRQNARIELEKALSRVMTGLVKDETQLFKLFSDNEVLRRWLTEAVFSLTYSSAPTD